MSGRARYLLGMKTPPSMHLSVSAIFGLLAITDLLVALLVPRETAMLLLGTLLTLQVILLYAVSQVWALTRRYQLLHGAYERELRFSQQTFGRLEQAMTLVNGDGRISYATPAAQTVLGTPMQELIGKRPSDLSFAYEAASQQAQPPRSTQLRRGDGSLLRVLVSGYPCWYQGRLVGHLATLTPLDPPSRHELSLN